MRSLSMKCNANIGVEFCGVFTFGLALEFFPACNFACTCGTRYWRRRIYRFVVICAGHSRQLQVGTCVLPEGPADYHARPSRPGKQGATHLRSAFSFWGFVMQGIRIVLLLNFTVKSARTWHLLAAAPLSSWCSSLWAGRFGRWRIRRPGAHF